MMPPVNVSTSGTVGPLPLRAITLCVFVAGFSSPTLLQSAEPSAPTNALEPQRDARVAFQNGQYDQVIRLLEAAPPDSKQPRELLKVGVLSYVRLGRPESAFTVYTRLIPPGSPDDLALLRELAMAFITSRVHDPEEHLRIAAYTALTEIGSREVVPLLEDGLLDSSVLVRAQAAEGLGRSAPEADWTALKRALEDPFPAVRIAALNALGDRRDPTLQELLTRMARSEEGAIHVFVLAALVKLGQTDALAEIMSAATLPEANTRMAALGVLGRLKHPPSLTVLRQSLYDPNPDVRAFAAGALGEFGQAGAATALVRALEDESPRVRGTAAASLGRLRVAYTRPPLWQAARDPIPLVRVGAVEGLLRLGERDAVLAAADLARHSDPSVRSATALAVGSAGNRKALPVLETLIQDQQPQPRLMASRALGKVGGRAAIPLLKHALEDSDPAVRVAAAGSLAQVSSLPR
jgi:HEAT repeat protein